MLISTRWHRGRLYRDVILERISRLPGFQARMMESDKGKTMEGSSGRLYFLGGYSNCRDSWQVKTNWEAKECDMTCSRPLNSCHDPRGRFFFPRQSLGEELKLNTINAIKKKKKKKSLNWSSMKTLTEKMFSPSTFLGSLVFMNLDLVFLPRPHLHEQIALHSDTPASRYSTVSFGSHSQINTTWTRRPKQLSSASSSSSSSTHAVWGIALLASSIFKDLHISQKVTLSPRIKHTDL